MSHLSTITSENSLSVDCRVQLRPDVYDENFAHNLLQNANNKWKSRCMEETFVKRVEGIVARENLALIEPWSTKDLVITQSVRVSFQTADVQIGHRYVGRLTKFIRRQGLGLVDCLPVRDIIVKVESVDQTEPTDTTKRTEPVNSDIEVDDFVVIEILDAEKIANDVTITASGTFIRLATDEDLKSVNMFMNPRGSEEQP